MRAFPLNARSAVAVAFFLLAGAWTARASEDDGAARLIQRAFAKNPELVNYARTQNANITPMSNGRSFYLYWVPPDTEGAKTKILVPFHGEDGGAFEEFRFWHPYAAKRRFALLVIQWRLDAKGGSLENLQPFEAYGMVIESLLKHQNYPPASAVLYARGVGASMAYGVAALDRRKGGSGLVSGAVIDDGPAEFDKSPAREISVGALGLRVFDSVRWALSCRERCAEMQRTAVWILFHAGTVASFTEEPRAAGPGLREDEARLTKILSALGLFEG